jgi:hypothetical protein
VLARAQSATSYYYLALRSNNTVELKKLVNGSSTTLATASTTFTLNSWYTLSLEVSGTTLRGTVNGGTPLTATDTQYTSEQIGVATFNASARSGDVTVNDGPGPSPTTTTSSPSASPSVSPSVGPTTPPPSGGILGKSSGPTAAC